MARYIDADKIPYDYTNERGVPMTREIDIQNVPTADVRENVRGEWVRYDEDFQCSNCGFVLENMTQAIFYNYCPNCSADMRGKKNERID